MTLFSHCILCISCLNTAHRDHMCAADVHAFAFAIRRGTMGGGAVICHEVFAAEASEECTQHLYADIAVHEFDQCVFAAANFDCELSWGEALQGQDVEEPGFPVHGGDVAETGFAPMAIVLLDYSDDVSTQRLPTKLGRAMQHELGLIFMCIASFDAIGFGMIIRCTNCFNCRRNFGRNLRIAELRSDNTRVD